MADSSEWLTSQQVADAASIGKANIDDNPLLKSLVLNNPELHAVYESLGYSPELRRQMMNLASKILACCDPGSLAASRDPSSEETEVLLVPDGASSLHTALWYCSLDRNTYSTVIVQHLWDAAVEARTGLLAELQNGWGSFRKPEENRVSARRIWSVVHDGVNAVDCDRLPYEKLAKKQDFDGLLFDIAVGIPRKEESDRPTALAFAARAYLRAPWMHNGWMTERLVMDIFKPLRTDVRKTNLYPSFLPPVIAGSAAVVLYHFRLLELASVSLAVMLLLSVFVIIGVREVDRLARLTWEVDRVARELGEDWFCGKVLARRVERLYELGIPVPSVLSALVELLP